jgi:hypothetical protein
MILEQRACTYSNNSTTLRINITMMVPKLRIVSLLGFLLAPSNAFSNQQDVVVNVGMESVPTDDGAKPLLDSCPQALDGIATIRQETTVFDDVSFVIHRNGEADSCGIAPSSIAAIQGALETLQDCQGDQLDKYQVESVLTRLLADLLAEGTCESTEDEYDDQGLEETFYGYCDMGLDRTPILTDHDKLIRVPSTDSLPCRFFSREGVRISSLEQLKELAKQSQTAAAECPPDEQTCAAGGGLHLYAVPAGRVFMFAPKFVGEIFTLEHVTGREGQPISLEVLSMEPRVFDITNFFSPNEAAELIDKALNETSETHKLGRSTTGIKGTFYKKRTSENAWDTHGKTALVIKKRCFNVLGMDEYIEGHADGLQILRYNMSTAYTPHMDYLDDPGHGSFNYDSAGTGGNRFATILLYMTELGEHDGGETVFTEAWPPEVDPGDRVQIFDALKELRATGDATMLKRGSWEETMAATCRSHLSVRPTEARAVLFYSQHPNGEEDLSSKHGGCPVLGGEKWAANLWVFSTPRESYPGAPVKEGYEEPDTPSFSQVPAVFRNTGKDSRFDNAEVYYDEDGFFGKLGPKDPEVRVNTFAGHVWSIKSNGQTLKTFVIDDSEGQQEFVV